MTKADLHEQLDKLYNDLYFWHGLKEPLPLTAGARLNEIQPKIEALEAELSKIRQEQIRGLHER